jgi:hypothetical protein
MLSLAALAAAAPGIVPAPNPVAPRDPLITPSLVEYNPSRTVKFPRNIISDAKGQFDSVLSGLGSGIPSYVASGVPNFFQDFPTGDKVQSSLGIDDEQVAALPTQVLNIDPYANWTQQGWNVRFHGNVYKQPNTSESKLNDLANIFLVGTDIEDLPQEQQENARNVTASIFVLQQDNVKVAPIHLEPAQNQGSSGQPGGGGAVTATGGTQDITLPYNTTLEGDFDVFVPIELNGLTPGNETSNVSVSAHTSRVHLWATALLTWYHRRALLSSVISTTSFVSPRSLTPRKVFLTRSLAILCLGRTCLTSTATGAATCPTFTSTT